MTTRRLAVVMLGGAPDCGPHCPWYHADTYSDGDPAGEFCRHNRVTKITYDRTFAYPAIPHIEHRMIKMDGSSAPRPYWCPEHPSALSDGMLAAEAMLIRALRDRLRTRPRYAKAEFSFADTAERMKLAGLAQAIRAIRKARK